MTVIPSHVEELRIALEGRGRDARSHMRRKMRLMNEWPELWRAINAVVSEGVTREASYLEWLEQSMALWEGIGDDPDHPMHEAAVYYLDALTTARNMYDPMEER